MVSEKALQQNKMATAPVGKLLFTMSLPLMLSMVMEAFYNVVDSLFVAHVSENALTAVSLAFPIQLLIIAITVGTAAGVSAILSRLLGAKNRKGVDSVASNGIFLAIMTYLLFLILGLFFTKSYFAWQTSDAEIARLGVDYLTICMVFSFGSVGQVILQRILQSTGKTMLSMVSQLVGAAINIIFDPILIFGLCGFPRMEVIGAAVATVAGQIVAMVIAIYFNLTRNEEVHFHFKGFRPDRKMIVEIYRISAPAIVMQALNSLMALGVNLILIRVSSTMVAAFGIYIKVQGFIFMPAFGLNNGVIAIGAFNYGAKNKKRVDDTFKFGMIYAVAILLAGMVLVHVLATRILFLFDASDELLAIGVPALRIISLGYIFAAFSIIAQGIYQALGNGIYSLIVTLLRVAIFLLPVLYVFVKLFDANNVWWAFILSEVSASIVAALFLKRIYIQKIIPQKVIPAERENI
ncbi:MAG: MATE family efflux transporter [Synergistaceae bacterium]|jgi:putative MATE family efflux protein|nr:MATE family efflux transporter [Synergistaceae bacterium]